MDADKKALKAGLLKAAMVCMEERTSDWWSVTVTDVAEFCAAKEYATAMHEDGSVHPVTVAEWEAEKATTTPAIAATFLLLVRATL